MLPIPVHIGYLKKIIITEITATDKYASLKDMDMWHGKSVFHPTTFKKRTISITEK